VLNMAPKGKKFQKINMPELAREAGCVYVAAVSPANPKRLGKAIRRAILVAREVGPTYVQIFAPCPTNFKFKPQETIKKIKEREKDGTYLTREYITPEAQAYLTAIEGGKNDE